MRKLPALALVLLCEACSSPYNNDARLDATRKDVRTFMQSVAASISERGPAAWPEYFDKTPAFFLAVDGQVQFSDGPAAQAGIPRLARMIKKIELRWGDALRVDPLSDDLAMVGAPWHENVTLADGHLLDTSGYFTAVAERVQGRWQFRNAHWSSFQPNNFVK